ncbi:MAG: UDP-N-acetylmuramoyl-L-alanine--D-glutamate ligase [Planctomycetota bacterium]
MESFNQKRVLVIGLGRFGGGVGVTQWLARQGAIVTVTDQAPAATLDESIEAVANLGVTLHLGGHDLGDLNQTGLVVINPAVVKSRSEFFQEITRRNIAWTTEMNLFCERCPATVIGVTGSFGKSTTCAMLADALRACTDTKSAALQRVHLGGNIGYSLLNDLPNIAAIDLVVLEMSNAQLEDLPRIDWAPHTAVITNLYPHHLDRHGAFEAYVTAKLNVIGKSDQTRHIIAGDLHPKAEEWLTKRVHDHKVTRVDMFDSVMELKVPGRHNQRNAACVLATCKTLGLAESTVRRALGEFRGLPHRLELVRRIDGVDYVNDSKSTAPSAIEAALECFDQPIVAIVGGQKKDFSLDACANALAQRCRVVICVGESGPQFAAAFESAGQTPQTGPHPLTVHRTNTLEDAIILARKHAHIGDVVLFTPGAPSFDRYANFTQRGDHFATIVKALEAGD